MLLKGETLASVQDSGKLKQSFYIPELESFTGFYKICYAKCTSYVKCIN